MSAGEDDDQEEVNSEAGEEGESPCSMLLMMSLRLCQIMSPLQNAGGAGQRQSATICRQATICFSKALNDLAKRCRQRLDEGDDGSLDTDNLPGVLLLSIAATSATGSKLRICPLNGDMLVHSLQ